MKWGIETEDQADYSLLHLGDARARAGFRTLPEMTNNDYRWPDIESPEAAAIRADDPEINVLAKEFFDVEGEHVVELKRWIALHQSGQALPSAG